MTARSDGQERAQHADNLRRGNETAGVLNRLIVGLEGLSDTQRQVGKSLDHLDAGLRGLSGMVHEQSAAIKNLTATVTQDKQESIDADAKLNARVDRIARESGRKVVITALQYLVPVLTLTGAGVGWLLLNGPEILEKWARVYGAVWP